MMIREYNGYSDLRIGCDRQRNTLRRTVINGAENPSTVG